MITKLKRGYTWEYNPEIDKNEVTLKVGNDFLVIDSVGIYSLLCFLVRVLRQRRSKKNG